MLRSSQLRIVRWGWFLLDEDAQWVATIWTLNTIECVKWRWKRPRKAQQQLLRCQSRCVFLFLHCLREQRHTSYSCRFVNCLSPTRFHLSESLSPWAMCAGAASRSLTCAALFPPLHSCHPTNITSLNLLIETFEGPYLIEGKSN